jgi:hypothetical protein
VLPFTSGDEQMPKVKKQPTPRDYSCRAWFSVDEWIQDIAPQSRAKFYEDVKSGRVKTFMRGRRRHVLATERHDYPLRLAAAE